MAPPHIERDHSNLVGSYWYERTYVGVDLHLRRIRRASGASPSWAIKDQAPLGMTARPPACPTACPSIKTPAAG